MGAACLGIVLDLQVLLLIRVQGLEIRVQGARAWALFWTCRCCLSACSRSSSSTLLPVHSLNLQQQPQPVSTASRAGWGVWQAASAAWRSQSARAAVGKCGRGPQPPGPGHSAQWRVVRDRPCGARCADGDCRADEAPVQLVHLTAACCAGRSRARASVLPACPVLGTARQAWWTDICVFWSAAAAAAAQSCDSEVLPPESRMAECHRSHRCSSTLGLHLNARRTPGGAYFTGQLPACGCHRAHFWGCLRAGCGLGTLQSG